MESKTEIVKGLSDYGPVEEQKLETIAWVEKVDLEEKESAARQHDLNMWSEHSMLPIFLTVKEWQANECAKYIPGALHLERPVYISLKNKEQLLAQCKSSDLFFWVMSSQKCYADVIDYFFSLGYRYQLQRSTVHVAVNYFQRFVMLLPYLSIDQITVAWPSYPGKFPLSYRDTDVVAEACLMLAMAVQEDSPLSFVMSWRYACIRKLMNFIAAQLDFLLTVQSSVHWLMNILSLVFQQTKVKFNANDMGIFANPALFLRCCELLDAALHINHDFQPGTIAVASLLCVLPFDTVLDAVGTPEGISDAYAFMRQFNAYAAKTYTFPAKIHSQCASRKGMYLLAYTHDGLLNWIKDNAIKTSVLVTKHDDGTFGFCKDEVTVGTVGDLP